MIMNRNRFHLDTTPFIEDTYVYPRRWSKRVIMYAKAIVGSSLRLWWSSERDIRINRLCWLIDLKLKINVHDDENECGYESRLVSSWVGEYGKTRSSAVQGRVNEWGWNGGWIKNVLHSRSGEFLLMIDRLRSFSFFIQPNLLFLEYLSTNT